MMMPTKKRTLNPLCAHGHKREWSETQQRMICKPCKANEQKGLRARRKKLKKDKKSA